MRGEAWTADDIAVLTKLWANGATAAVIGDRLNGKTRSAVLGKIFRLRLRANAGDAPVAAAAPPLGGEGKTVLARRRRSRPRKRIALVPASAVRGKTLLELTNVTCRWPHGRPGTRLFFFCGAAGADLERGIPYCAKHMRRAYRGGVTVEKVEPVGSNTTGRSGVNP